MGEEREIPNGMPGKPITSTDLTRGGEYAENPDDDSTEEIIVDYDVSDDSKKLETYEGVDEETQKTQPIAVPEKPTVRPDDTEIHENHLDANPYASRRK